MPNQAQTQSPACHGGQRSSRCTADEKGRSGAAAHTKLGGRRGGRRFAVARAALVAWAWLGAVAGATSTLARPSSTADFASCFANPPAQARIFKIIHGWPDTPAAQDEWISRLTRQGFGGVVCNVSFDQYLESDAHWQSFTRAVAAARKAGLALWLYDERGYPSGNAGGLVLREHPEWEARGLLVADTESRGGSVQLELPPGRLVLAGAFPVRNGQISLTEQVELGGQVLGRTLRWDAPEGHWRVLAITEDRLYEGTHADGNLWQKMPYVNLLQPEPTKLFLDLTHERYAAHLGGDLGRYFVATFTDEPSLMSCFLKPMPFRPLPWAANLPGEFQRRRGYAPAAALLPALVADSGPQGSRFRHDFWLTIGELVSENFFGQIQTRCRRLNIPSGGHLLMEESPVAHVPLYGDFFRCLRRLDAPSMDCLTSLPAEVPWFVARLVASAAELEGRSTVMCETSDHAQVWRPAGDNRPKRIVSESEIRGTCNRLFVSGVNAITSYYSFTDLEEAALQRLNDWVGRCATLLTGGHQVADVAVLYPAESLWTHFTPARHWANDSPAAMHIEHCYRAALDALFAAQRDFTIVDSRALAEARVRSGALVHGQLRWRVVVLPAVDTLPLAAWKNLARFVRSGGVLIALAARPRNSETHFPCPQVQALADELFGRSSDGPRVVARRSGGAGVFLPAGAEGLLPLALDGVLERDVQVHERGAPIRVTHRRIQGHEVYLLINDSPRPWQGDVTFCATGPGERWDIARGGRAEEQLGPRVRLSLQPYDAAGFRYPGARLPRRQTARSGDLPNLSCRPTPLVAPKVARGEFVRADLTPDPAHAAAGLPAWRASASLTRGGVDTFLFVRFEQAQPLDLSEAACLVLDTWVPEGQRTPNQILVILQEQGGGDFVAATGRLLGKRGHQRVFLPLSRLQLAGWAHDADGVLDLRRVSDIRVGWGGYLGAEGERVEFSVALPQTGGF